MNTRSSWIYFLTKLSKPVLHNLAKSELKQNIPVKADQSRKQFIALEAFGRLMAGLGPWLNLTDLPADEKDVHSEHLALVKKCIENACNKQSPDFMNFTSGTQPIVDAAFLAQGLLRCWDSVWLNLPNHVQKNVIECMISSRQIKPHYNNWLLFSAMIEAFLGKAIGTFDKMRVDYAIREHFNWYVGDGAYGDGPAFKWDYYNSYVIQPMLFDLVLTVNELSDVFKSFMSRIQERLVRYAEIQERMIAPDGSFPVIGRSLTYRGGAFQALALVAYHELLSDNLAPGAVRCALTAAIKRTLEGAANFDESGWLEPGLCANQPNLAEKYICTGSLYLCSTVFLPLGLPDASTFWSAKDELFTCEKVWSGVNIEADKAIKN